MIHEGSEKIARVYNAYKKSLHNIKLRYHSSYLWARMHWPEKITAFSPLPIDLWEGNAAQGQAILNGFFVVQDQNRRVHQLPWSDLAVLFGKKDLLFSPYLYSFSWLRDLKATGEMSARRLARRMIEYWITAGLSKRKDARNHPSGYSIASKRLSSWILLYNFFGASARDTFRRIFFKGLQNEYRLLKRDFMKKRPDIEKISVIKACLEYNAFIDYDRKFSALLLQELDFMQEHLHAWMHKGEISPEEIFTQFCHMLEIRNALSHLGQKNIALRHHTARIFEDTFLVVQNLLKQMVQWTRFYRHSNGELCQMGGTSPARTLYNTNAKQNNIDIALSQVDSTSRRASIDALGIMRGSAKHSVLFVNTRPISPSAMNLQGYSPNVLPDVLNIEWSNESTLLIRQSHCLLFPKAEPSHGRHKMNLDAFTPTRSISQTPEGFSFDGAIENQELAFAHKRDIFLSASDKLLSITDAFITEDEATPIMLQQFKLSDTMHLQKIQYEKGDAHGEIWFSIDAEHPMKLVKKRAKRTKLCVIQIIASDPIYLEVKTIHNAPVLTLMALLQPDAPCHINWSFQVQKN